MEFGLTLILFALVLSTLLRSSRFKGAIGEFVTNRAARKKLNKDIYRMFHDVTLPAGNGTTQIDHIIVSIYGVFVLETKNMTGWIFGGERNKTWTQIIYKKKQAFQNPIHQNYKHVKTLQAFLDLPDEVFFSLVNFVGDCEFKTKMPKNVTKGREFIDFIRDQQQQLLNEKQVYAAITQIESSMMPRSFLTHRQHIKHVKSLRDAKKG